MLREKVIESAVRCGCLPKAVNYAVLIHPSVALLVALRWFGSLLHRILNKTLLVLVPFYIGLVNILSKESEVQLNRYSLRLLDSRGSEDRQISLQLTYIPQLLGKH